MTTDDSGIDAAQFVGPDDGRRHWTLPHLRNLQLLIVDRLIVALSGIDLVDSDPQALTDDRRSNDIVGL